MDSLFRLLFMRFRTRVFTLFLLLAVFSSLLVAAFMYWPTHKLFYDLLRTNVLSVAATAAAMIDPVEHEKIKTRTDQDTPTYNALEKQLRKARDANRRQDFNIKYIYTMRPYAADPNSTVFVMDAEETGPDKSNVGDPYKTQNPNYKIRFNDYQADEELITDQWGTWLTANAPIRDAQGDVVGALGVDVSAKEALARLRGLLWNAAFALAISIIAAYLLASIAANRLARPLVAIRQAVDHITAGDFTKPLTVNSKDEFGEVAAALDKMAVGLQQREDLKNALTRYVSEDILNEVIYTGKSGDLFSQRKKVTILFADVRGFTALSEQLSPEETVSLLNDYFEKMIEAVFKNNGHLNKFMGDGLMALFGALRDDDYQEEHAIQAALDMRGVLSDLQKKWSTSQDQSRRSLTELRIGIGINTGLAIVGNIGSKQRMEFTAIGDAVNLASRLEQATRERQVDILVSEYTFVSARNRFPFEPAGEIPLKGKSESVRTYTVKPTA
ncbi:MAG: adenylate/guanylate cyclase domain-containing protein [Terrimicrobiaceae bacterium]